MFVRTILIAMAGIVMFGGPPATADDSWKLPLRWQLDTEQRCDVGYFTNVRIGKVNGRQVVAGRAHCRDGRAFEVVRTDVLRPFALKQCLIAEEA